MSFMESCQPLLANVGVQQGVHLLFYTNLSGHVSLVTVARWRDRCLHPNNPEEKNKHQNVGITSN